jgi:hypothetical protein
MTRRAALQSLQGNLINLDAFIPVIKDYSSRSIRNMYFGMRVLDLKPTHSVSIQRNFRDTVEICFINMEQQDEVHKIDAKMTIQFKKGTVIYQILATGKITAEFDEAYDGYLHVLQNYLYIIMTRTIAENPEMKTFYELEFPETLEQLAGERRPRHNIYDVRTYSWEDSPVEEEGEELTIHEMDTTEF